MAQDVSCLMSTVRNISGTKKTFAFLPPHSVELDDDEEYTMAGSVTEACIRGQRVTSQRHLKGLQDALRNGYLEIVETPAVILRDVVTEDVQMLELRNGALGTTAPCWESESLSE